MGTGTSSRSDQASIDLPVVIADARVCMDSSVAGGGRKNCREARERLAPCVVGIARSIRSAADGKEPYSLDPRQREAIVAYARAWLEDPELHQARAAEQAWRVIIETVVACDDLTQIADAKLLSLVGEIHRRRWEASGQSRDLRRAASYKLLAFEPPGKLALPPHATHDTNTECPDRHRVLAGCEAAQLIVEIARIEERVLNALERPTRYAERVKPIHEFAHDRRDLMDRLGGWSAKDLRAKATGIRIRVLGGLDVLTATPEHEADWELWAARAATLLGLRRYEAAVAASERARKWLDENDNYGLQRWARELVMTARQQGIRPESQAIADADQSGRERAQLHMDRLTEEEAALLREGEGLDLHSIGLEQRYDSVKAAHEAYLRAEQKAAFAVVNALMPRRGGEDQSTVFSAFTGKVGIALSGGGFRAALYHVGVLAALADLGLLRHIQVISCVSGGSIVGTHYYLLVKRLLETTVDADITDEHYVALVGELHDALMDTVHHDLRNRIFLNPIANFRMMGRYSPSKRMGDLFQKFLFDRVAEVDPATLVPAAERDGRSTRPITTVAAAGPVEYLSDLRVRPAVEYGVPDDFHTGFKPHRHNWRRSAKVPILILNATSLNTGHNWQFTAKHMGEPPAIIHPEIDANPRLRRVYLAAEPQRRRFSSARADAPVVRLGHAVAASAAVPGLFEPMAIEPGYDPMLVRLADGGVVDNQGIAGLLEQNCDILLVSDASGQLGPSVKPGGGLMPAFRSRLIAQERIRSAEYEGLKTLRRSQLIRDFMFVHLTHGLVPSEISWRAETPDDAGDDRVLDAPIGEIDVKIQEALARVRTDLDSFSEAESMAQMTAGYLATHRSLRDGIGPYQPHPELEETRFGLEPAQRRRWPFFAIRAAMGSPSRDGSPALLTHLTKARRRMGRWIPLAGTPKAATIALMALALVAAGWATLVYWPGWPILTAAGWYLAALAALTVVVWVLGSATRRSPISWRAALWRVLLFALGTAMTFSAAAFLVARRVLPRRGSLERLGIRSSRRSAYVTQRRETMTTRTMGTWLRRSTFELDRLEESIDVTQLELAGQDTAKGAASRASKLVDKAGIALNEGKIAAGWAALNAAKREVMADLEADALHVEADRIMHESEEKLSGWRGADVKKALTDLEKLGIADQRYRVQHAQEILDEHLSNVYRKLDLVGSYLGRAAILLILALGVFGAVVAFDLAGAGESTVLGSWRQLLTVMALGAGGAVVSSVLALLQREGTTKIPEVRANLRLMVLRPFVGAASAVVLLVILQSGLGGAIEVTSAGVYAAALVSGFSERLVTRAVEGATATLGK